MSRFAKVKQENTQDLGELDARYRLGQADEVEYEIKSKKGLTERLVRQISKRKSEPKWMLEMRLSALKRFEEMPIPKWGGDIGAIKFDEIHYYLRPKMKEVKSWDEVPKEVKATFEKIGVPQAEREYLAGVKSQFDSEVIYGSLKKVLAKKGVVFLSMDEGLKQYPDIVKKYFGTVVPLGDNKLAALNTAVWSGGSFVYVPKGVEVDLPLQAYFRINSENAGQFERTLIVVEEGAKVHYVEGCFLAGTMIETGGGRKVIESITKKDKVLTHLGRLRKVNYLQSREYSGGLYRIKYWGDSTEELVLTEEHPILAVRRVLKNERNGSWKRDWLKPGEINVGDYLTIPVDRETRIREIVGFKVKTWSGKNKGYIEVVRDVPCTPEFFRLVGYYLAEGSISSGSYLNFSFSKYEREYIEDVKRLMKKVFGQEKSHESVHKKNNGISVVFSSVELCQIFENFGKKSYLKQIPEWMVHESEDKQRELLVGWYRGDGNYYRKRHSSGLKEVFRINTTSEKLVRQLRTVLLRLGVVSYINARERGDEGRRMMYTLGVSGEWMVKFGEMVGVEVRMKVNDKKRATKFGFDGDYMYVPVRQIRCDQVRTKRVYNFGVDRDESYVAGGVAVHNCSAPAYTSGSLHAAVVEIVVKAGARCQYTTVQNWYKNVFNLVTKRAWVGEGGEMRWIDGNLGCIAENQKLITPDGVVKIEQIKVGQKVLSYDERKERLVFRRVLAKRNSGRQRVYDVSIGARKIRVTRNHPFYSYRYDSTRPKKLGRYELGFVRADELSKAIVPRTSLDYGKEYGLKKPKLRTEFWSGNQHKNGLRVVREQKSRLKIGDRTTGKLMWLFGYWLGDGDMSIKYGVNEKVVRWAKLGFSCPKDNRARERLMGIMSEVVGASPTERKDGVHVSWSSKELVELFVTNGFVGKAIDKRVPGWVWSLPEEQRVAFVSGYIDADGTVKEGRIDIKSVNKTLLEDVASLLVTLGITSRLFTVFSESREVIIQGYKTVAHGSYRLSFEIDGRFERYIAGVLVDKIKQVSPKVKEQKRLVGRSGIKLGGDVEIARVKFEDVGKELPTWDIEVEGTGNFICEGFIVHNSRLTMKYPACILAGKGAKGETLSIAWAGEGQHQDAGAKMIHLAPKTSSRIISKSISKDGGRASYRGMVQMSKGARGAKSKVVCDALILDDKSRSDTYPVNRIWENEVSLEHEATVSKVGEEQLFYLMSRGISEHEAEAMIVNGFLEPVMKEIPFEYAIEMNRLVNLEMEGSVG